MPRQARKTAQIFGSNAGANQLAVIGSAAAGAQAFSTDPAVIQSLAQYLGGWFNVALGYSPSIEDMNSLCYLFAYQIAYGMQLGMPEWDSATTYYKGSLAQDGAGNIYASTIDNNLNQSLTATASWRPISQNFGNMVQLSTPGNVALSSYPSGTTFLVDSTKGNYNLVLPAAPAGGFNYNFTVKDIGGALNQNAYQTTPATAATSQPYITVSGATTIDGAAVTTYPLLTPFGSWKFFSINGVNWFTLN